MGFRKDFIWGAATASYQIEGGWDQDGKGLSVWDMFSHEKGKVFGNQNGDTACDHYHRFKEDVSLMAELGIPNYRLSFSWPRIFPEGKGAVNEKGAAFYDRLMDALLEKGITPYVTLFHWDYPYALDCMGAWRNPDSAKWYADYAEFCAKRYGDRVKNYITLNEPQCFISLGYETGEHAPGLKYPKHMLVPMAHNTLKGHGLAVQAIRAQVKDVRVGYAPCGNVAIPASDKPEDVEAARRAYFATREEDGLFTIAWWSDPALLGRYPEDGLKLYERYLPKNWQQDLETVCQPLDYYCQNIYWGYKVAADGADCRKVALPDGTGKTAIGWCITPEALYWGPKFLYERYKTPIVISENGMSNTDVVSLDGKVHDPQRIDFTHRYLLNYRRAAEDGVNLMGYFHWSLMDNFEWAKGYDDRFGMIYVDYGTGRRIPKDSAEWYRDVIRSNGENL